jgi:hypothetical protein
LAGEDVWSDRSSARARFTLKSDFGVSPPAAQLSSTASSMHRLIRNLKSARDRALVVIIAGHGDRKIEPGEHLNIAALGKFSAGNDEPAIRVRIREKSNALAWSAGGQHFAPDHKHRLQNASHSRSAIG